MGRRGGCEKSSEWPGNTGRQEPGRLAGNSPGKKRKSETGNEKGMTNT